MENFLFFVLVPCVGRGLIHTGRTTRRTHKLEHFSFDVACEQCEHPIDNNRSHLLVLCVRVLCELTLRFAFCQVLQTIVFVFADEDALTGADVTEIPSDLTSGFAELTGHESENSEEILLSGASVMSKLSSESYKMTPVSSIIGMETGSRKGSTIKSKSEVTRSSSKGS